MKVSIIGEGAWGTAVATVLAQNKHDVLIWCYHEVAANEINNQRQNNMYMPGVRLSEKIKASTNLQEVIEYSDFIFEAIPVQYLRSVLNQAKSFIKPNQKWVSLSKGIESGSLLFPTQIFDEIFENKTINAVISGPSFAQELIKKDLTAVNCASFDLNIAKEISDILNNEYFRACPTNDLIGVQAAAALKNVITLGVGIAQGADCGDNTKAMIITVGMNEISNLVKALGGKAETVYGLAGLGDLILTSTGKYSRNLEVGKRFGQGQTVEKIISDTGYTPESINTVKSIFQLSKKYNVHIPLCMGIFNIISGSRSVKEFFPSLFNCLV